VSIANRFLDKCNEHVPLCSVNQTISSYHFTSDVMSVLNKMLSAARALAVLRDERRAFWYDQPFLVKQNLFRPPQLINWHFLTRQITFPIPWKWYEKAHDKCPINARRSARRGWEMVTTSERCSRVGNWGYP